MLEDRWIAIVRDHGPMLRGPEAFQKTALRRLAQHATYALVFRDIENLEQAAGARSIASARKHSSHRGELKTTGKFAVVMRPDRPGWAAVQSSSLNQLRRKVRCHYD